MTETPEKEHVMETPTLPTDAVFAHLIQLQKETLENRAKSAELLNKVSAVREQMKRDKAVLEELDKNKETLTVTQQSLNGRLEALRVERDRNVEQERKCRQREQTAEKMFEDTAAKMRAARKAHSMEALRLMKTGQDITQHYVMELDGKLEEVETEVVVLKQEVHDTCKKSAHEDMPNVDDAFPDYPDVGREDCRMVLKIVKEMAEQGSGKNSPVDFTPLF